MSYNIFNAQHTKHFVKIFGKVACLRINYKVQKDKRLSLIATQSWIFLFYKHEAFNHEGKCDFKTLGPEFEGFQSTEIVEHLPIYEN